MRGHFEKLLVLCWSRVRFGELLRGAASAVRVHFVELLVLRWSRVHFGELLRGAAAAVQVRFGGLLVLYWALHAEDLWVTVEVMCVGRLRYFSGV